MPRKTWPEPGVPDSRRARVLFVPGANPSATFVAHDRELLRGVADCVEVAPARGFVPRVRFTRDLHAALGRQPCDVALMWFAAPGYGTLAASACRRRGVPLVVVAGGAEVANVPSAGFGAARSPWRRRLVRRILESAAEVWALSPSAAEEIAAVAPAVHPTVVPPAVDTAYFRPGPERREPLVVTVCATLTEVTARQKGVTRLVEAARCRPGLAFVVVGHFDAADRWVRAWRAAAPPNVTFTGRLDRGALRDLYARAHVYVQLSLHEGFGVAVAEALGAGCVPVVTPLPSLVWIAGSASEPVAGDAGPAVIAGALDRALARQPPPDCAPELERRYGMDARRAALSAMVRRYAPARS